MMMGPEQIDAICSKLNINETAKQSAIKQYKEITENTILSVSMTQRLMSHPLVTRSVGGKELPDKTNDLTSKIYFN